jgi:hypothetical protein
MEEKRRGRRKRRRNRIYNGKRRSRKTGMRKETCQEKGGVEMEGRRVNGE